MRLTSIWRRVCFDLQERISLTIPSNNTRNSMHDFICLTLIENSGNKR